MLESDFSNNIIDFFYKIENLYNRDNFALIYFSIIALFNI